MRSILCFSILLVLFSCSKKDIKEEARLFLDEYSRQYKELYYQRALAEWDLNTRIMEGDTLNASKARQADEAYAAFVGSEEVITKTQKLLDEKDKLDSLQIRQLEVILYKAGNQPAVVADVVKERIRAEKEQTEKLFGFDFQIDGQSVSTNEIDRILNEETDTNKRLAAWEASKEVGKPLRSGLVTLRELRNKTVQGLDYNDYFTYEVSDYGMTRQEMLDLCDQLIRDIWPLYRELHTYMRYELAKKYNQPVPDMLPAHWLPNRWGQDWSGMVQVEGLNLDNILEEKGAEWLVRQSEQFYVSMGFEELPPVFYEKSSLYPLPDTAAYKKNNHASAWHMDLEKDVRSLMSVIPTIEWYETTHHELGHIYYYLEYTNPNVPPVLRRGANRAFHEAIGSMLGLAAMQKPFIEAIGLIPEGAKTNEIQALLKEALNYVAFIPWSAGVMTRFEHDLYAENLPQNQFNQRWWELKAKYQGIAPPSQRGEEYCDAASKTHISDDAAQYYDYALSFAIMFQIHNHIAKNILKEDPRATNYYGNKEVGEFLHELLSVGATRDWRELMRETVGEDISARAMLEYFEPLMVFLKELNEGKSYTLPQEFGK